MSTLCGANCSECSFKDKCRGCEETAGSPFGGKCIAEKYIKIGGMSAFEEFKQKLILEINELKVIGMPEIKELYCLCGSYVNLEYPLPSGAKVKLLKDEDIYLGAQVEPEFDVPRETETCYGIVAGMDFILVCEYGCEGSNPELVLFKRR